MANFYEETLRVLKSNGKTPNDIRWIGTDDKRFLTTDIKHLFNFEYNNGFGLESINRDLKVVGDDWWLERHEYDGSEWWEFKTMPSKPTKVGKINLRNDWIN